MGEIHALTTVVVVDKESHRSLQRRQGATETATGAGQTRQIGAQIGIEAFHRVGVCFAYRQHMLPAFGPDQFGIHGQPIAGLAPSRGQRIGQGLEQGQTALLTHRLAHNQPGVAGDCHHDRDDVFFCWTKVESSSSSIVSVEVVSVIWVGKVVAAWLIQLLTVW
jgi:hypothetical protein